MSKRVWTLEEDNYIIENFNNLTLTEMAKFLCCSIQTIQGRAEYLGLSVNKRTTRRWTKEEEQLLVEYSKKYITKTIARKLGRSYIAVQKKAVKMGIELHGEVDPWKKWMIDYLKENINKKPIGEICSTIGLSYCRVLTKCKELGIEYVKENWTEEEINILREYADKCHYTELVKVLPNRSVGAISAKAYELGIEIIIDYHKLDDKVAIYIKDNWGKLPATQIARNLKVSTGIVYKYRKKLNLPNVGQKKKWTDEKIQMLRRDAKTKTRIELAKKYKTSVQQINTIATRYEIKLINSRTIWNDELDKKLLELMDKDLSINEIAQEMKLKANSIRQHLKQLGITKYCSTKQTAKKWTLDEIEKLKEMSKVADCTEIANALGKTKTQVFNKANKLGISIKSDSKHTWSDEEIKILKNLSDGYERHMIAQILDRSEGAVKEKAKELKIPLIVRDRKWWSPGEEQLLCEYAKEYCVKEIAYFLERSVASVDSKLKYIGIKAEPSPKFWTEEEIKQLINLANDYTKEEISKIMDKDYGAVSYKLYQLGIKCKSNYNHPWTEEEESELLELLTTYSSFEVAEMLERSEEAVIVRAIKLGYEVTAKNRKWTEEEEQLLSDLWGNYSIEYIANSLNRTISSIVNRVYKLNLGSQIDNNYDGLTIQEISNIFGVHRNVILTSWVSLGLKISFQRRSKQNRYAYVTIENLYDFLEANQNIWDSRNLERNILGIEPNWLIEKRKRDIEQSSKLFKLGNIYKQQLINSNQYFLDDIDNDDKGKQLTKTKQN